MFRIPKTKNGYDFYECASAIQKAIRRNDIVVAEYFAVELWEMNYGNYVWKRLYTISAEDCFGIVTTEIEALHSGYQLVNKTADKPKGRIFLAKAVILLCQCRKCRDADHLNCLVVDKITADDTRIAAALDDVRSNPIPIPAYTFDVHTRKGKKAGKTKEEFFEDEYNALEPRIPGLFDETVPHNENLFTESSE
jgi:replication-associated recombination protein RarA